MGSAAMNDDDLEMQASAFGILQCLRSLASEASSLHMFRTLSAIEDALEAAASESGMDQVEDVCRPAGARLH
jgi:hypothetical protein